MSIPYAVTPFSYRPTCLPLRKISPAWRMPSNSRKTQLPVSAAGSLKCLRYQDIPLYVPMSPPPWEMSLRKESTSLKLWGVATVVHLESSKSGTSALGTSSRMNLQSRLKFSIERGDLGGIYGPLADGAAANAG